MKNLLRKIAITFLLIVVSVCCFSAFSKAQFIEVDAFYATPQSNITIHKNFKLETATNENYRKFSIAERYNSEEPTLYNAYCSFAGEANQPVDFSAGGVLIEANAYGETSTVRLFDALSSATQESVSTRTGDGFSIIAQPIMETLYDESWNSSSADRDYQTLSFTFNDLDSDNWITLQLKGTVYGTTYVTLTAHNNGKDISTDAKNGKNISNVSFYGPAQYLNTSRNVPIVLRFDPANPQKVYLTHKANSQYTQFTVTNAAELPVLNRYSVDMTFGEKNQVNTAKLMVYELCKQSMAGDVITDTTAPTVSQIFAPSNMVKGYPYAISAEAYDLIEGVISNDFIAINVMDADGTYIEPNNGQWTFVESGEYTVAATATDSAGNVGKEYKKTITIAETDTSAPSIEVIGEYEDAYFIGNSITLLTANYSDNTALKSYGISIQKDTNPITISGNTFLPEQTGRYTVIYQAIDETGNIQSQEYSFLVFGFDMPQTINIAYTAEPTLIPQPTGIPMGWYYTVHLYKAEDEQMTNPLPMENDAYTYTGGEYFLYYCLYSSYNDTPVGYNKVSVVAEKDTVKPEMVLNGEYQETYALNETLTLLDVLVTDNSNSFGLSVKVYCNENELTVENNIVVLDTTGEYKVVYEAKDAAGNATTLEYRFTVSGNEGQGCGGCGGCNGNITPSIFLLALVAVGTLLVCKRKEN